MSNRTDRLLGLASVIFALAVLFVWIPLDTDSGLVETVRRRRVIGDALAPTLACVFVLIGGVMLWLSRHAAPGAAEGGTHGPWFGIALSAVISVGFVLMLVAGPLAVALENAVSDASRDYRNLRDTVPWKYAGFTLGTTFAIAAMTWLTERRVSLLPFFVGLAASALMIVVFDLPFDDLLLPPNGDF